MKQTCKRLAALVLALSMCLSLLSVTAWAAEATEDLTTTGEAVSASSEDEADESNESISALSSDTTEVQMTVTYGQTEARSMLSMINEFRTGSDAWYWNEDDTTKTTCTDLDKLTYDYSLEAIAMQRAAEIALSYSHTRPNGGTPLTAYTEYGYNWGYTLYAYGENIAAGYASAEAVFEGWQETDEDYSGQGHRRNMLSSNFTAVGIAHVTYNGVHYWVQEFGYPKTLNTTSTTANNKSTTVSIEVASSSISSVSLTASPTSYSLTCGGSSTLPTLTATLRLTNTWPITSKPTVSVSYTWSSGNTKVATVSGSEVKAVAAGSTTLTASALGTTASVPVTVAHSYTETTTAATCTQDGSTTYTCSCGDTYAETIPATGHIEAEAVQENEVTATCTTAGSYDSVVYCSVCGAELSRETVTVAATGHTWDEGVVTQEATCDESGMKLHTCTTCGATKTELIPATGHTFAEPVFVWAEDYSSATAIFACTDEGCDNTAEEEAEIISQITAATCTEDGQGVYTAIATFDGVDYTETKTVTLPATGHSYEAVVTEATCTQGGYTTHTCTVCGDSYITDETDPLGHSYEAVVTEATCTEDGCITYTCATCGDRYTETIPATGHTFEDGVCTVCGTVETIDLSTCTVTLSATSYTYDGKAKEPAVTVKDANGNTLTKGTDYTVKYTNNTKYGTATVTITGAGKYVGSVEKKFTITYATPTLSSVSNTTSGVKITWKAVTGAAKYRVFRKTGSGSWTKVADTTSTSYTDTTAKSGTTYKYTVRCVNSAGSSYTSSYNTTGLTIKYLTAGKISSLTNTSSGVTIKWTKVTGASGYKIYRKTSSGSYSLIKTITSGSTVSYTDTAVKSKNGTTYVYAVRPYSGSYTGSYTGKTTVRLTGVSISSLTNVKTKKMTVKWAKNTKATGYQIQYSTSSSFSSGVKTVTVTSASTVSKTISSLTKNKKYYVRVRAYKTVSGTKYYSAWSSTKNVKISK